MQDRKICFLCGYDSSVKMSGFLAAAFKNEGYEVHFFILGNKSEQMTKLLESFQIVENISYGSLNEFFVRDIWRGYDVLHILDLGTIIRDFCAEIYRQLGSNPQKRPLIFTGLIGTLGGAVAHCYLHRQMVDLLYAGGEFDRDRLRQVAKAMGDPAEKIVATGLPIFDGMSQRAAKNDYTNVLFAGQPTFPKERTERSWIVKQLIELARTNPEKNFILKPRVRPGESTIHQPTHHFEELFEEVKQDVPANFSISYDNIQALMMKSDLVITISSTAAFEAMAAGVSVCFISDFGVSEGFGNHIFLDSGCMRSFKELRAGNWPVMDWSWVSKLIRREPGSSERIVRKVNQLLEIKSEDLTQGKLPNFLHMETTYLSQDQKQLNIDSKSMIHKRTIVGKIRYYFTKNIISVIRTLRKMRFVNRVFIKAVHFLRRVYQETN